MIRSVRTVFGHAHRHSDILNFGHAECRFYASTVRRDGRTTRSNSPAPSTARVTRQKRETASSNVITDESKTKRRYFNTTKTDSESREKPKRLLYPHVLSERLKKLCDDGKIDIAVDQLKNAPLDAQNTPVWNTLIWECMKAQRFTLAYRLFTDMKRRGFSPTTRTFQTMFAGLSRIDRWSTHTKQLNNAHSLYEYFMQHLAAVKKHDPRSPELTVTPLSSYIKLLGDAGEYQKVFDVYYAMDQEGALSPNLFIFTSMFRVISERQVPSEDVDSTVHYQNASDAKLLWRQMLKASQRSPGFEIDAHAISVALKAMSRGRLTDQDFAFDIIREYLGLAKSGDAAPLPKVPLTAPTLEVALDLCNNMQKHDLCIDFVQQVIDQRLKPGEVSILDRGHLDQVLKAYTSMAAAGSVGAAHKALKTLEWMLKQEITGTNGSRIRPATSTFKLVLTSCWHNADWRSAIKTFELMTGYDAGDFRDTWDGVAQKTYRMEQRTKGRNLVPDDHAMSSMLRTALATRDRANVRQCLRMVDVVGVDLTGAKKVKNTVTEEKRSAFYQTKLAAALTEAVDLVLPSGASSNPEGDEVRRWTVLRSRANDTLRAGTAREQRARAV